MEFGVRNTIETTIKLISLSKDSPCVLSFFDSDKFIKYVLLTIIGKMEKYHE